MCPEARRAASRIVKEATWADEIISRTSALYRKDTTQRERVDVNAVIRDMAVLLQQEAAASSVSIRTELADGLPEVIADRVQLQQVFMNLMLNAIEAMKDTGGDLTITSEMREPGELLISVSDTGVGLPTDTTGTIFDAFVTTKPHGTGMGLAITRSIVDAHGGRLWARRQHRTRRDLLLYAGRRRGRDASISGALAIPQDCERAAASKPGEPTAAQGPRTCQR